MERGQNIYLLIVMLKIAVSSYALIIIDEIMLQTVSRNE